MVSGYGQTVDGGRGGVWLWTDTANKESTASLVFGSSSVSAPVQCE